MEEVYEKFIGGGQLQPKLGMLKRFIRSLLWVDRCSLSWRIWKRFIRILSGVDRCSLSWGFGRGLFQVYYWGTELAEAGDLEEVYCKFISGGQMQPQLGIWKRFIITFSVVDRCSLSWGSGRGLLEVYQGWADAASAGDLEEIY